MDQNGTTKPPSLNAVRMMRQQIELKDRNIRQLFDDRGQLEEALETNWNDLLNVGYNPPMTPKPEVTLTHDEWVTVMKAKEMSCIPNTMLKAFLRDGGKLKKLQKQLRAKKK